MTSESWYNLTLAASGSISYPEQNQTFSPQVRRNALAGLRDKAGLRAGDIEQQHRKSQLDDLEARTHIKARSGVPALLEELATDRGMAWTDIARLAGVSVGAVRKWRSGGSATPENRQILAMLSAFLDLLEEFAVVDPAQWLEMPLKPGFTITAIDLYNRDTVTYLLDFASRRWDADKLLDRLRPDWRSQHRSDHEVVEAPDGALSIRARKE